MISEWRFKIFDPAGRFRYHRGISDPVESLESFELGGDGDCKEATFTGLASGLGIGPRDIVALEAFEGVWSPWFRGAAYIPGAPTSPHLSRFKLVGLRERFNEIPVRTPVIAENAEVGDVLRALLNNADHRPPGTFLGGLIHNFGFGIGTRYPRLESVFELLEDLADALPGFTVPPGETYPYGGVKTFVAGEYVPPAVWGVLPSGEIFFRRDLSSRAISPGGGDVSVSSLELDAERVVSEAIAIVIDRNGTAEPETLFHNVGGEEALMCRARPM